MSAIWACEGKKIARRSPSRHRAELIMCGWIFFWEMNGGSYSCNKTFQNCSCVFIVFYIDADFAMATKVFQNLNECWLLCD
jgi:hypothetical protein